MRYVNVTPDANKVITEGGKSPYGESNVLSFDAQIAEVKGEINTLREVVSTSSRHNKWFIGIIGTIMAAAAAFTYFYIGLRNDFRNDYINLNDRYYSALLEMHVVDECEFADVHEQIEK